MKRNVIYPYLRNYSRELEWSIKSLKNVEHGDVYVIGQAPDYPIDAQIITPQVPPMWARISPYNDVIHKILTYAEKHDGYFLLMNDDIFLIDKYDGTVYHRGLLSDRTQGSLNVYRKGLKNTENWLIQNNYPIKDYDCHTPMVMNSQKFIDLVQRILPLLNMGHNLMIRSLYGNVYGVESEKIDVDPKNPPDYQSRKILSTNEETFMGEIGLYIRHKLSGVPVLEKKLQTVDVVIPVYNGARYIEACLDSIPEHKSIKNIIVCDDKSTDNTLELLKKYKKRKLTILENEINRGVGFTFNKLLDNVESDYVLRVDSDDLVRPEMVQVLDQLDGTTDIFYYNMVDFPSGMLRQCTPYNKHLLVANFHVYKTSLIGDTRTITTNWGEDAHFLHELLKKNPTEKFTNINAYGYNYPRSDSLTGLRKQRKKYLLAIMTNATNTCLTDPTIFNTINSWKQYFGEPENIEIFLDPNPNPHLLDEYRQSIVDKLGIEPIITTSLSDGYRQALEMNYEFIFYVEHDWLFEGVKHSVGDILGMMKTDRRWFMLFNQHKNIDMPELARWQSYLKPHNNNYCLTDRISNNPHIIWRDMYRSKAMHLVDWTVPGAGMIEQVLEKKFEVAVYGEYGKEPTIIHTDGRKGGRK